MAFAKEMINAKKRLESMGHSVMVSQFIKDFLHISEEEKQKINKRNVLEKDAIREFWKKIIKSDAILVLNYDRNGIKNYVGGNTLMEIGFAHVLGRKIFLLNPIPEIPFYKAEIEGVKPIILHNTLRSIK